MNKFFNSLVLLSCTLLFTPTTATTPVPNHVAKLAPSIIKKANPWRKEATQTLGQESQLVFANFFALLNSGNYPALIKCAEYIESHPELHPLSQKLSINSMEDLKTYAEEMEAKIARKKDLTEEQEESLWQKLDIKIQELLAYINSVYYELLYNHMAQKDASALVYIFDEHGLIPQEKRMQLLPQPE